MAAALLWLPVVACGAETAQANRHSSDEAAAPERRSAVIQLPEHEDVDAAPNKEDRLIAQSDELFLQMADRACRSGDFYSFFRAFSGSWAVRQKYTAGNLAIGAEGRSRRLNRHEYLEKAVFPVSPMDNDYVTAASAVNFERSDNGSWREFVYVRLTFDFAQDNRVRVEWTPGIFEKHLDPPPMELQEGLGRMIRQTADGGFLLFAPSDTCWELSADIAQLAARPLNK